jgi:hypothetical protein
LVSFQAAVPDGQTVTLTLYLSSTVGVNGYAKFQDGSWSILPADRVAIFDDRVEITVTDGGPGDDDGASNGIIVDPGGVVIADGARLVGELLDQLGAMVLAHGTTTSLSASLRTGLEAFNRGQLRAGCSTIQAFSNKVTALTDKKIPTDQASALLQAAADVRSVMRCG